MIFGRRPWFACAEPERPTDAWVRWHIYNCTGCQIKAQALTLQYPNDPHVRYLADILTRAE